MLFIQKYHLLMFYFYYYMKYNNCIGVILMNRITILRKKEKLSQSELAEKLNISQQSISSYENGKREPDNETLKKLADFFNVTTDYLLGRTDDPETVALRGDEIPKELRDVGIQYLELAKEMQDKQLSPESIKNLLKVVQDIKDK